MTDSYTCHLGSPSELGSSVTSKGVNFAVYSKHASRILLCLFDGDKEIAQLPFIGRTQHIWHMEVAGLKAGQHYGLRAEGPFEPHQQHFFNPHKLLMDPYGKCFSEKLVCHPAQSAMDANQQLETSNSAFCVPKTIVYDSKVSAKRPTKNWITPASRSLYELHVKGFSQGLPIEENLKGTYLGVVSEKGIAHLKSLGISTIQLMPCFSFASESRLLDLGLSNYWGYNPINFFAPEPSYAIEDPINEFKAMVDGLHQAGFEVILDVVYNHTAESEMHQASVCYKGLDNHTYYRHDHGNYLNYTGCGNCVDTYQPASIRLIMDSMRYWVSEMGVDGFRFDLGVDLGRTDHDYSPKAPLLEAISQDPILSNTCLVSEPWDIGPNGYQVGNFPVNFFECNDKYRDTIRRFWRGDEGQIQGLATRLMGSRDVFHKGHKSALMSVNYVTYHDGYTLRDLVSYHRRHNLANMENNRDGHGDNISQNFGIEGSTTDETINQRRLNQQECLLATLLLSQGTPHILGGDELSHSQQGNNNAYCQDNEITWLNWEDSTEKNHLMHSIQTLLQLRREYPILAEVRLEDDALFLHQEHDHVSWINETGCPMSMDDWNEPEQDYLGLVLSPAEANFALWVGFYREDMPMNFNPPENTRNLTCLFKTSGVNVSEHKISADQRSVFLMKIELD